MNDFMQRQSFLGADSDQRLTDSRVAIVGLCGGGSHIGQQLAHVGVGNFALFDHDRAEPPNHNRMVGLTAAAARSNALKTDVIETLIKAINPDARVDAYPTKWQLNADALQSCTAIFGCVDSFSERSQLEAYARRLMIPYIDIGMDVTGGSGAHVISGQVILSMPGCHCMRCMGFLNEEVLALEAQRYGQAGGKAQVIWPNGTLASTAVGLFMSILTPWTKAATPACYIEYDGNRFTAKPSNRLAALAGIECRHFSGPDALGDAW